METKTKIVPNNLMIFYNSLANGVEQRKFMRSVREKTGVAPISAYSWVRDGVIPVSQRDREIIAELCGKDVAEFWGDITVTKRGGKNRGK